MKATDVLERCRAGAAEVQQLDQRLNRLLSCGADPATIERDVLKCRHALDERARRLDAEKLAACRIVDMLPDPECCILYRYYVMGQNQGSISTALHIAVRTYKAQKRSGLALVEQMDDGSVTALLPAWYLEMEGGTGE